ncbi:T9SS type A sorting domain-containing protein [Brumimicrobium sp.]|uniref:T9SS type A sorting domain-containing protein n=1 Tax=Brumimicrobium sp. TaxID=2029867 RepID=UPI003A916744
MIRFFITLFFAIVISFSLTAQNHFTTSVEVQGNKTIVIELITTGVEINGSTTPPYTCPDGYNYNVLFDYSIKAYNNQGKEVEFKNIYTLQGVFICNNETSFFDLPNSLDEGSGKTVGNIWKGDSDCNSATVESLYCNEIVFEIEMKGYDGSRYITVPGTSLLPIELITFDAIKKDRQVELSWKTATETNNDFFTIARSVDGKYWEDLQYIEGAGNSVQVQEYSYTDDAPYAGISYYRLTQTDFDGTQKTFPIVSVEQKDLEVLQAYPNPVVHTVTLMGVKENQAIRIFNAVGIEVTENTQFSISPSKKTLINMNDLPKGVYYIVNGAKQIKVLKQ